MDPILQRLVEETYTRGSDQLSHLLVADLRHLARNLQLSGYSRMNKGELVELITTNVVMYYNMLHTLTEARQLRSELQEATSQLYYDEASRNERQRQQQLEEELLVDEYNDTDILDEDLLQY